MATELEWHHSIRDLLDERIARRDVWVMLSVQAEHDLSLGSLDEDSFLTSVSNWIDLSLDAEASPLQTLGSDTRECTIGDNDELQVTLTLLPRTYPVGPLVGNPEPVITAWIGCPNCESMNTTYYASAMRTGTGNDAGEYEAYKDYLSCDECGSGFTRGPGVSRWVPVDASAE